MRLFHYLEHLFFLDSLYLHPIYIHIPQYEGIMKLSLSLHISRVVPLLTIGGRIAKGLVVPLSPRFPHLISGCFDKQIHVESLQHRMLKMLN